jgi:hypothetical protein
MGVIIGNVTPGKEINQTIEVFVARLDVKDRNSIAQAEDVARMIYSATTDGADRLRYLVGNDTRGFIKAKQQMSDGDYVTFMRSWFLPNS